MSADCFLDTKIIVYIFDKTAPEKRRIAAELAQPDSRNWAISWQVVQEFSSLALHRFESPFLGEDLDAYLDLVLLWVREKLLSGPHILLFTTRTFSGAS